MEKTKNELRDEIKTAMKSFKKPIRKITKEDEYLELADGCWTDFTMRCGEDGILPGYQK